jgi:hypothetical protein
MTDLITLTARAERELAPIFADIDRIAFENTRRVMDAFPRMRVQAPKLPSMDRVRALAESVAETAHDALMSLEDR